MAGRKGVRPGQVIRASDPRNPLGELMQLVSEMYDARTGRVKIKGFYDDVEAPTKSELQDFRNAGFSVKQFKKDHLFKSIRTDDAMEVMKRIWATPTFEVHGLVGGFDPQDNVLWNFSYADD